MVLFCAVIRRNSVSLLRFPFRGHVQVFSSAISSVYRLKSPYICFSSHFCFLVFVGFLFCLQLSELFCYLLIWLVFVFFNIVLESFCWCVYGVSMLACPLPPSFLGTYIIVYLSSLGYKALVRNHQFSCFLVHLYEFFSYPFYKLAPTTF